MLPLQQITFEFAEDDNFFRAMLQAVVSRWGFEVVAVADGNEAWLRLQAAGASRLALLDWEMPNMNGIEICRRVRTLDFSEPPLSCPADGARRLGRYRRRTQGRRQRLHHLHLLPQDTNGPGELGSAGDLHHGTVGRAVKPWDLPRGACTGNIRIPSEDSSENGESAGIRDGYQPMSNLHHRPVDQ